MNCTTILMKYITLFHPAKRTEYAGKFGARIRALDSGNYKFLLSLIVPKHIEIFKCRLSITKKSMLDFFLKKMNLLTEEDEKIRLLPIQHLIPPNQSPASLRQKFLGV